MAGVLLRWSWWFGKAVCQSVREANTALRSAFLDVSLTTEPAWLSPERPILYLGRAFFLQNNWEELKVYSSTV